MACQGREAMAGFSKLKQHNNMAIIYKNGSRGTVVKQIQKIAGCYPDGIWGPLTTEAVRTWQKSHGLKADGIAGPATLAKMGINAVEQMLGLKKSKRTITDIVVHCTASKENVHLTVEQIRTMHTAPKSKGGRGWSDIGYHYVVYLDGTVHEGRDVNISGAHVSGHNAHSIGIVYVGGLDSKGKAKDTRTEKQKTALFALLVDLRKIYPEAKIRGHRDFSPDLNNNGFIEPEEWIKECPCFNAISEYRNV